MRVRSLTLALLILPAPLAAKASVKKAWPVYVNVLHRYRVCYPDHLLTPQGETDNSAGQAFRGRDGAELSLHGYYQDDGASLALELMESASASTGLDGGLSHRRVRANWGVVSGSNGHGGNFFLKMIKRRDQILKLELRYPASAAARYRPVVAKLSKCFVAMR